MKNQTWLNFFFFSCFLVLGFSVSTKLDPTEQSSLSEAVNMMTTSSSNSIQSMNNGQRTILVIGVDSLDVSNPQLVSMWMVTYLPADSNLRLLPIYPSGQETISDFEARLNHSFSIKRNNDIQVLSQDFIRLLEENNYWWSGYLVLDYVALTHLFNSLGDVMINDQISSGDKAILDLTHAADSPEKAFSTQLAIVQTACRNLTELMDNPYWSNDISLVSDHLLTDMDLQQYVLEWKASLSGEQSPNCRFPTLELSRIDN